MNASKVCSIKYEIIDNDIAVLSTRMTINWDECSIKDILQIGIQISPGFMPAMSVICLYFMRSKSLLPHDETARTKSTFYCVKMILNCLVPVIGLFRFQMERKWCERKDNFHWSRIIQFHSTKSNNFAAHEVVKIFIWIGRVFIGKQFSSV